MRKSINHFLSFFAFASIVFLASCGEDGELPIPGDDSITLTSNSIEDDTLRGFAGDTVYVTANLGIGSTGEITVTSNGSSITVPAPNTVTSGDSIAIVFNENAAVDATAELTFTSGSINEQLTTQVVYDNSVAANTYTTVLLQAPTGNRTSETFFSAANGMTYTVNEVIEGENLSDSIDFGYYYGNTNQASLASPSVYSAQIYNLGANGANWGTLNETMFLPTNELDPADFDAIAEDMGARLVEEYEVASAAGGTPTAQITQLAVGDTYSFMTARGQYGIVRVDAVDPGAESNKSITITVKVTPVEE